MINETHYKNNVDVFSGHKEHFEINFGKNRTPLVLSYNSPPTFIFTRKILRRHLIHK